MKYCTKCGCRIDEGMTACPSCGFAAMPKASEYGTECAAAAPEEAKAHDNAAAPEEAKAHDNAAAAPEETKAHDSAAAPGQSMPAPAPGMNGGSGFAGYSAQQYNAVCAAQVKPRRGLSLAGMVIGIVCCGIILLLCCCITWPLMFLLAASAVGLVLSIMGLRREPAGKGMAIAGIIMNATSFIVFLLLLAVFVAMLVLSVNTDAPFAPDDYMPWLTALRLP